MMTIVLALRARTPHSNTTYVFRVSKGIACRKMLFGKTLIVGGSDFWYQSQSKFSSHSFIFAIVICGWKAMLVHSSWLKIWPDKSSVRRFVVPQTCFMRVLKPIGSFHTRNIKKSLRKLICAVFKSVMDSKRICWCLSVDFRVLIFKNVLVARVMYEYECHARTTTYGTENLTTWSPKRSLQHAFFLLTKITSPYQSITQFPIVQLRESIQQYLCSSAKREFSFRHNRVSIRLLLLSDFFVVWVSNVSDLWRNWNIKMWKWLKFSRFALEHYVRPHRDSENRISF